MSRSGYDDYGDDLALGRWRAQVASAIRGRRGQALLRELVAALDEMPEKRLTAERIEDDDGCVCALGAVAKRRGLNTRALDLEVDDLCEYEIPKLLGGKLDIAHQLAAEIMFVNDEEREWENPTPERRWEIVRKWAESKLVGGAS